MILGNFASKRLASSLVGSAQDEGPWNHTGHGWRVASALRTSYYHLAKGESDTQESTVLSHRAVELGFGTQVNRWLRTVRDTLNC